MDFDFTPEEKTFREELRTWFAAKAPSILADGPQYSDPEKRWDRATRWHKSLFEAGWVGIYWPKQFGGRGATLIEQYIYEEESDRIGAPGTTNPVGLNIAGPTIMQWGTDEQKNRYLRPILSGDEIWCQGYSEPGAGSDVASLTTRAEDRGDNFVVNGQKVWTTLAHRSQFCLLLCRTDPGAPKHKGLSYMLVDMKTPGITVRPLVQMTGNHDFNEIFFEDVVVPKRNLLGPQNDGWRVGVTTLMFERVTVGALLQIEREAGRVRELLKQPDPSGNRPADDPSVRQRFAQLESDCQAARYSSLRSLTRRLKGQPPGPEGSIAKLFRTEVMLRMMSFAEEVLGPYAQIVEGSPFAVEHGRWMHSYFYARAQTIAGGTSEIQRNVIGERVLGLPKG
ncbi:MAG TPA: acyl-CoA dehydrogenase family protein [Candidatus Binataceae bacterium]|nr:acyl-CoA dehydrogenase family protein [Candidatus Binataceae bacterium]